MLPEEMRTSISFVAGPEFMEKLERVREVMYAAVGSGSLETVFMKLMEHYLKQRCPEERSERRRVRKARKLQLQAQLAVRELGVLQGVAEEVVEKMPERTPDPRESSYIPLALRDEVMERDGFQCGYAAADGTRCGARKDLQIDHVVPVAAGGVTEAGNLRVACRAHNLMFARQQFGEEVVREAIRWRESSKSVDTYVQPYGGERFFERLVFGDMRTVG